MARPIRPGGLTSERNGSAAHALASRLVKDKSGDLCLSFETEAIIANHIFVEWHFDRFANRLSPRLTYLDCIVPHRNRPKGITASPVGYCAGSTQRDRGTRDSRSILIIDH